MYELRKFGYKLIGDTAKLKFKIEYRRYMFELYFRYDRNCQDN